MHVQTTPRWVALKYTSLFVGWQHVANYRNADNASFCFLHESAPPLPFSYVSLPAAFCFFPFFAVPVLLVVASNSHVHDESYPSLPLKYGDVLRTLSVFAQTLSATLDIPLHPFYALSRNGDAT